MRYASACSETQVTINNCVGLLEQAIDLIERVDDALFVSTGPLSPRGSIGGHVRHILDFYQSFLNGLESGHINYNLRQRDWQTEQERLEALKRIIETVSALQSLPLLDGGTYLLVSTEEGSATAPVWCVSSIMRELDFL